MHNFKNLKEYITNIEKTSGNPVYPTFFEQYSSNFQEMFLTF